MRISVDDERCQGHALCWNYAPDLFELDDLGFAHAVGTGEVDDDDVERARRTEAACPERAITLLDD